MAEQVKFTYDKVQRMHPNEMRELQVMLNTNGTEDETWFDEEIPVVYVEEIDDVEFFDRYFYTGE